LIGVSSPQINLGAFTLEYGKTSTPENPGKLVERGDEYVRQQNLDGAILEYDKAIALDPSNALAFSHRAFARYGQGNLKMLWLIAIKLLPSTPTRRWPTQHEAQYTSNKETQNWL